MHTVQFNKQMLCGNTKFKVTTFFKHFNISEIYNWIQVSKWPKLLINLNYYIEMPCTKLETLVRRLTSQYKMDNIK